MIKNLYWKKFKLKTEKNFEPQKDEKNIMDLVRPLSLEKIKNLRNRKLNIFIDDVISNKKVNNLLFSTNAKKELNFFYRQQNTVLKNMNFVTSYDQNRKNKGISEIAEIVLKKKNDLIYKNIKNDIGEFKLYKENELKKYMKKILKSCKNKNIENIYETSTKMFFKPVNDIRYSSYKRCLKTCFEKCKSDPNFNLPDI